MVSLMPRDGLQLAALAQEIASLKGHCKGKLPLSDRPEHDPQVLFNSGVGFGTHGDEKELWQGFDYNGTLVSYIYSCWSTESWQSGSHGQNHILNVRVHVYSFVLRALSFDAL